MTENPRLGIVEDAPLWWPNWKAREFTEKDQCEIERYCRKIVENVSKEKGMTPWERWKTTLALGIPDRPIVWMLVDPCAVSRALDCWSGSFKPGYDMYNYPESFVKANLAYVAKFQHDQVCAYTLWGAITMVEWGGSCRVRMSPNMQPAPIDPPVKTEADWDRIHMPDVHRDGFLPLSIWAFRKIKEFMNKYGVSEVMPLMTFTEIVVDLGAVCILMGMRWGMAAMKRTPELCHKACKLLLTHNIDFIKAMQEAGADISMSSKENNWQGLEVAKQFQKYDVELAKAVDRGNHIFLGSTVGDAGAELENQCAVGGYGTGWYLPNDIPYDVQRRVATKYKKVFLCETTKVPLLTRKASDVAESVKQGIKACAGPGFVVATNQDAHATIENLDTYVRTAKEYGREVYKGLK